MTAYDPWTVRRSVYNPEPRDGNAQISALRQARPYEPPPSFATDNAPIRRLPSILLSLAIVLVAAASISALGLALSADLDSHRCTVSPAIRGFEGG